MLSPTLVFQTVLVGVLATAVMDAWLWLLQRLGVPTAGFAMVGRWVGHMARGRLIHAAIARAAPVRFELALGWLTHYLIGIAYAVLLVALCGADWLAQPSWPAALVFGLATVAAPWFVMQPAMGAGVLALKTPTPLKNALRNLANHAVFGTGLYLAATAIA
jgi:hypothetical protein